ncbi:ZIP family zinc transporter [Herbihabitans rhizosphaerae]|uniref:ZIP family zinc transporter n=1 Tax=Herbihabitans rhizosphaerae TaxID=1872711 RepID=A0A4Q7KCB2_9PSEU|nr:ZIP family zinc transporter [Herbihabitans rhizosphaerae]RZS29488.1 ZIP family zinc transporter [Herbihabitans rhizosphaerae]
MLEATFWGFVGGAALIVGAVLGLLIDVPRRVIGLIMAFGAGVLISALAFDLTGEALRAGGFGAVALGLFAGSAVFFLADRWLDRRGGSGRKRSAAGPDDEVSFGLVLGAVLDGIPESVVIGVSLLGGEGVGVAMVVAVFLSNVPESLSAATGLRGRRSPMWIIGLWTAVTVVSALSAGLGNLALGDAPPEVVAAIQAFAAGAILTMLVDTMIPEAYDAEGRSKATGLVTTAGFALAVLLTTLE